MSSMESYDDASKKQKIKGADNKQESTTAAAAAVAPASLPLSSGSPDLAAAASVAAAAVIPSSSPPAICTSADMYVRMPHFPVMKTDNYTPRDLEAETAALLELTAGAGMEDVTFAEWTMMDMQQRFIHMAGIQHEKKESEEWITRTLESRSAAASPFTAAASSSSPAAAASSSLASLPPSLNRDVRTAAAVEFEQKKDPSQGPLIHPNSPIGKLFLSPSPLVLLPTSSASTNNLLPNEQLASRSFMRGIIEPLESLSHHRLVLLPEMQLLKFVANLDHQSLGVSSDVPYPFFAPLRRESLHQLLSQVAEPGRPLRPHDSGISELQWSLFSAYYYARTSAKERKEAVEQRNSQDRCTFLTSPTSTSIASAAGAAASSPVAKTGIDFSELEKQSLQPGTGAAICQTARSLFRNKDKVNLDLPILKPDIAILIRPNTPELLRDLPIVTVAELKLDGLFSKILNKYNQAKNPSLKTLDFMAPPLCLALADLPTLEGKPDAVRTSTLAAILQLLNYMIGIPTTVRANGVGESYGILSTDIHTIYCRLDRVPAGANKFSLQFFMSRIFSEDWDSRVPLNLPIINTKRAALMITTAGYDASTRKPIPLPNDLISRAETALSSLPPMLSQVIRKLNSKSNLERVNFRFINNSRFFAFFIEDPAKASMTSWILKACLATTASSSQEELKLLVELKHEHAVYKELNKHHTNSLNVPCLKYGGWMFAPDLEVFKSAAAAADDDDDVAAASKSPGAKSSKSSKPSRNPRSKICLYYFIITPKCGISADQWIKQMMESSSAAAAAAAASAAAPSAVTVDSKATSEVKDALKAALQWLHERGWLHGDIRLPNFTLERASSAASSPLRAYVIDFGCAEKKTEEETLKTEEEWSQACKQEMETLELRMAVAFNEKKQETHATASAAATSMDD